MKTIKDNITNTLVIKNSKFITLIIKLDNNNINDILNNIKKEYPKATHYVYAYSYLNNRYYSDDNEPSSSAGKPILNIIEKENLDNILIVVVRYFGGIKLGIGGLIRAYSSSTIEALKQTTYIELIEGYKVKITFDYQDVKQIDYLTKNYIINEKIYNEKITYIISLPKSDITIFNNYNIELLENIFIEKNSSP